MLTSPLFSTDLKFWVSKTTLARKIRLGTGQYLWEYGTGKFATGPPVILTLCSNGATNYFEGWPYGAMAYFSAGFQQGQRLFRSTAVQGHGLFVVFSGLFHIKNTGPEQIYITGIRFSLEGDFNRAVEII